MLGFTIGILWLCLRRYKPLALGWFRGKLWPPKWALKVLLACAVAFPLAMFLGDVSQVSPQEACIAASCKVWTILIHGKQ